MQFNKTFLVISIFVVAASLMGYRAVAKANASEEATAEASQDEKDKKDDKLSGAFKSLDKKVGGKETPIIVSAEPVLRGNLIQTVSTQGRVYAYQQAELMAEVPGRLMKLTVKDGSRVKKGDVIALIDDREYKLALQEAEAKMWEAKANYLEYDTELELEKKEESAKTALDELEKKYKDGLISKTQYEREKFRMEMVDLRSGNKRLEIAAAKTMGQAEIGLERARLNLEKCTLRAPFSGVIFGVEVSTGELINSSTKIAELVNMTDLVVKAQVLESEIGVVERGRRARVTFPALPDLEENEGKVQAVSPFVNEENKTVEAILAIKSKDGRIRPGMFAESKIDAHIFEDRLMVPKAAILPRDDRKVVFKVSPEKRAKWEYVTTGVENDEYVEIVKGNLTAGDMVLTDNHFTMGHDTLVKISKKRK